MAIFTEREADRLRVLDSYHIVDSKEELEYNDLAHLASELCNTPIALISFLDVDRQWYKATVGWHLRELPRSHVFCDYANEDTDLLVIEDTHACPKFLNHPLVTGEANVRFYAGVPLITEDGEALGTLSVMDHHPRQLTPQKYVQLNLLARQVMQLLELRRKNVELEAALEDLDHKNSLLNTQVLMKQQDLLRASEELDTLLYKASHDLARPIASLMGLAQLASKEVDTEEGRLLCNAVKTTVQDMRNLVVKFQQIHEVVLPEPKAVPMSMMGFQQTIFIARHAVRERFPEADFEISFDVKQMVQIHLDPNFWHIILTNLLENSWVFRKKLRGDRPKLWLRVISGSNTLAISLNDNGEGFMPNTIDNATRMFYRGSEASKGNGLGLYVVERAMQSLGGTLQLESRLGEGTTVHMLIPHQHPHKKIPIVGSEDEE